MKILLKLSIAMILIFVSFTCSEREPDIFYQKLDFEIEEPSVDTGGVFPPTPPGSPLVSWLEIVIPVEKNNTEFHIIIENIVGRLVYNKHYVDRYNSYPSFLQNLTNGKLSIPAEYIDSLNFTMKIDTNFYGYVNSNDKILKEYSEKGFSYILEKYFTELGNYKKIFRYRLENKETTISYNSIYKIMFENKYLGGTDCVSGETTFFRFLKE